MLDTYTAYVEFPELGIEEVDVQASDEADAREKAAVILNRDYLPDWKIVSIEWRAPAGWMFI